MQDKEIMISGILKTKGLVRNQLKVTFKIYHFFNKDKKQKMKSTKQINN